tara:strand:- start:44 stop:334 length:291 start_codon:yes stop_codon:yes gene_type:complete
MKITKQRLKEIIKEELEDVPYYVGPDIEDFPEPEEDEDPMASRLGTPEERLLTLINARKVLSGMSDEELEQLSLSLDGETVRALQHLLANPMYKEQ